MARASRKRSPGRKKSPKRKKSPAGRKKSPGQKKSGKTSSKSRTLKEEERLLQEEEEAKLKAEQEENERLEAEKRVRKEIELNERLIELRESEAPQTQEELETLNKIHELPDDYVKPDPEWVRYMKCDRKPDPTKKSEINTFITLTKENVHIDMDVILKEAQTILELIAQLKTILKDPEQIIAEHQKKDYQQTITKLEELLKYRYDQATMQLLMDATDEADADTGNLQTVIKGANEVFFVWGNLNKNPRFKTFEFKVDYMQFEIPKFLSTADVAVRVLKTNYDHYSHYTETFLPRVKKIISLPTEITEESQPKEDEEEKKDVAIESGRVSAASSVMPVKAPSEISVSSMGSTLSKSGQKIKKGKGIAKKTSKLSLKDLKDDKTENQGEDAIMSVILDAVVEEDVMEYIDLRIYSRLGAVYHFNLLEMPPQPKVINRWTIRELTARPLTDYPFFPESVDLRPSSRIGMSVMTSSPDTANAEEKGQERTPSIRSALATSDPQNLIGVSFKLPENVMFLENPQVAIWDKIDLRWKTEGISAVQCLPLRMISFKTSEPCIFGLFQKTYLNIPFRSWEMKPIGENSCYLTLTGAVTEVELKFEGAKCQVSHIGTSDPSQLQHLLKKWFSVEEIIEEMEKTGLHFFPPEDAGIILNVKFKDLNLDQVYHEIAILSTSYAFGWSKWNSYALDHQVIIKVAAFCVDGSDNDLETVPDDEWCNYMVASDRCYKLDLPYLGQDFTDAIHDSANHHSDLLHALRLTPLLGDTDHSNLATIFKRSRSVDPHYVNAVHKMLKAVDPISFS